MEKLVSPEHVRPIKRLFIAQRGEIAVRALQACKKRLARGESIQVVVPYTFSDLNPIASRIVAQHQKDGWELVPLPGIRQEQSYANPDRLINTAISHSCDTIFLGYGFLSEETDFIRQCEEAGVKPLAPPSGVMEATGNKMRARDIARETKIGRIATIPVLEGSDDIRTFEEAVKAASHLKYPVMVKDPNLGGGRGNLVARDEKELEIAYKTLKGRPENKQLFLERYVENAVHVEVQIVADQYGNVVSLGERDCTVQRRAQKIIEEAPSPNISPRLRAILQTAAVNFAKRIGYQGLGTWEFIIDLDKKGRGGDPAWYFMEINPRIQVEHRITEEITGIDLVELMMDIAEGKPLPFTQDQIKPHGHAIEYRVYAEDPLRNFEVTPGRVDVFRYPTIKEGVRVAPAVEEGDSLSQWYDNTLILVVAKGNTREEARRRAVEFGLELEIAGIPSNLSADLALLNSDEFRNARVTTRFAEQYLREQTQQRIQSGGIINGGSVSSQQPSLRFEPSLMPQNTTVIPERIDGQRNEQGQQLPYSEYLERTKQRTGRECAAQHYIIERDGVRFVLYDLDYSIQAGTLGVQEGNVFEDACQLAYKEHLPLVTISRSGGARQWENSLALFQMGRTVATLDKYPPKLFVNIYAGPTYGGVPASFAGVADVEMAVDSPDTHIGFSGPYIVAKDSGKNPATFRAEDAYKALPEGTHSPVTHYQDRNIHILVSSLEEAGDIINHLIRINRRALTEAIVDPNFPFQPREKLVYQEIYGKALRYDRPGRSHVWVRRFGSFLGRHLSAQLIGETDLRPLTVAQKMEILRRGDRPTTADFLDPRLGLVDDARFLTSPPFEFPDIQQYPTIIAACANIGEYDLFILGQQTQRVYEAESKTWKKRYEGQKPADWEYVLHMLGVARKLRLPLLLLGDTNGADPSPESESRNQSHKIAKVIQEINRYPYPVLSGLIGLKGSGGGETFIRPLDFAFDAEHALSFVATPMVQYWILTSKWIDDTATDEEKAELVWYMNQLKDATAQGRLELKMIDAIVKEGRGGAHLHPQFFAKEIRREIIRILQFLLRLPKEELLERRWARIAAVSSLVSVPF